MNFEALKQFMDKLTSWRIPGCDCGIYYNNEPVFRYSSGYADIENKKSFTEDTLINIYSCSKVITCTGAMHLYENGGFLLTDPLYEYIPEYKEMYIKTIIDGNEEFVRAQNPITIRDLFTMSAGFTYNISCPSIENVRDVTNGRCPTVDVAKAIARELLLFEPGTHWNYSLCHDVLAAVVEIISGQRFNTYMKENIFEPARMNDTSYICTPEAEMRMAEQYRFDNKLEKSINTGKVNSYRIGTEYDSGGAGIVTSVNDYLSFANIMANGGKTKDGYQILSKRGIDLMRTNQLNEQQLKDFNWIQLTGYGYGLGVRTLIDPAKGGALSAKGEFGWPGAAGSYGIIDPENKLAVFYAQHLLNNQEPYVHPRLRNIIYSCLSK